MNWLLRRLSLNPNAYYSYRKHREDAKTKAKAKTCILRTITALYHESDGSLGYRQMRDMLAGQGIHLSAPTVHRYMNKELGLRSVTRKPRYHYVKGTAQDAIFENLLKQDFTAQRRNEKWCIDFTYVYFGKHMKRYSCTIIDLYDRRVVSSVCGKRIDAQLAVATLQKALESIGGETGMILHSDRGSQFTSNVFIKFCEENGVIQSMSRPGCPYDNAPMERYFNTLKADRLKLHKYESENQLFLAIQSYAFGWYNNRRPHSYNGGIPPAKVS